MARGAMLVGSYPGQDAESAITMALRELGPHLVSLSDGETGERSQWVVPVIDSLRGNPNLRLKRDGKWDGYDDPQTFAVRRGHKLDPASIQLGYPENYRAGRPVFDRLRGQHGRPDLPFQVGIPGDLDMALFSMGTGGAFRYRKQFAAALGREMAEIHALGGDDVVFQLEVPVEQVFVIKAPGPLRPVMASWMAGNIARLAGLAPAGARLGIHLCLGDLRHQSLGKLRDTAPLVALANRIAERWPSHVRLERIHFPLAEAEDPPPLDEAFYEPLSGLRLPAGVRMVAGFLHESRQPEELRKILATVESAVGSTVDVAASCGLGRRSVEAGMATIAQAAELCAG